MKKLIYILVFSVFTLVVAAQNKKGNTGSDGNTKPSASSEKGNLSDRELTDHLLTKFSSSNKVEFDDINTASKSDPESVTSLKLRRQGLTEIPANLSKFKNLIELDLSDNEITDFSSKLMDLPNLEVLNLSGNKLTSIPPDICNLKNLKILNLSGNKIASGSISCVSSLERLYLNNNELTSIPSGITEIQSLKSLYLHSNKLLVLDEKLAKLPNLEVLFVQFNKIAEEPSIFKSTGIINYIFYPQSINNKQLYKYMKTDQSYSVTVAENTERSSGVSSILRNLGNQTNKKAGPWDRLGAYFASRGGLLGNSFSELDGEGFFVEAELGFKNSSFGVSYAENNDDRAGIFYKRYFRDITHRFRPYARLGLDLEVDDLTLGFQAKGGFDFYLLKFFGINFEAGYARDGYIAVGGIVRLNFKKKQSGS